jgi:class 3 adenylate cyclase/tetratricopeptide (TPR) repeat protein
MASSVTATFVFTDLVGSTELLSRVGEAQADELRREHFGLLRKVIEQTGGREVKNLGDGLMVMFEGVPAALEAAVGMQQAVTARPIEAEPLSIRVGVAVGEAEREDGDYFGLPVVEAARLCAKAEGGEILTTELVRMLGRSRSTAELESVGALELKGLDEPVETYRVRWAPVAASEQRPPLPSRLASSVGTNFVGRVAEGEQLETAWKAVSTDRECRVMLLAGEPGIGKTTLSARFACDRYAEGAGVVYGRCDEDLGIPYQPWIEALTQLVRHAPESVLTAHVADRGSHLARLVPELSRRVPVETVAGGDADTERFVLFGCVVDLLARASDEHPVLFVLDDLHWADRGSVQLLRHVVNSDEALRVGILGTFRDSEITTDHPLSDFLAALHRQNRGVRIPMHGFNDDDLLRLLETIAGHEMDEQGVALRDALLAETAGNPFFVAEILRHLVETHTIYQQDDGRWVAESDLRAVGLPVSVREVVGQRLTGLGPDTERILGLGAVIGRDFDITLLAAVAQLDEDTLIDLCDAAVEAAVLQPTDDPDRYTFAHALIEHTLYDGLSLARRARAHKAVAEKLEAITGEDGGARVGELAYHWSEAVQPTDTARAVHYARLAGERALDQLAPDEALRWYSRALELVDSTPNPDVRERAAILVGLGDAQRVSGVSGSRETLLEASRLADSIDDVDLLVRAALANNRGFYSLVGEGDHDLIATVDRAIERLDDAPTTERARLVAMACSERTYVADLEERLALAEEAIALAHASGDPAAFVNVVTLIGEPVNAPSTVALRTEWVSEACAIADAHSDTVARYWAHWNAMGLAVERADGDAFARHVAVMEVEAQRIPHATIQWTRAFGRVLEAVLRGDLGEAERLNEISVTLGSESGQPDAMAIFSAQLVNISYHQGRVHELVPLIEEAVEDSPGLPVYRAVLANALAEAGRKDEVRRLLRDDLCDGFEMRMDLAWTTALGSWAKAASRVHDIDACTALRELLLPHVKLIMTTHATLDSSIAHHLGQLEHTLGNLDAADRWFAEAAGLHERLLSPLLTAYTDAARAAVLADRNRHDDHQRARDMAGRALAAATAGGYGYIERDARAVLEQLDSASA